MQDEIQSLRECLTENENLRLSNQRLQNEINELRNKQHQAEEGEEDAEQQQDAEQILINHHNNNNNNHSNNNHSDSSALLLSPSDDDECELTLNSLNTTYANVQLFSPNARTIIGPAVTTTATTSGGTLVNTNTGIIYAKRELIIRDYVD
uniref:Outer membrane protein (OmpH-like) n=2 Tax=Musca domestica TaxID=7370 RepID=T1PJT6_MUSDO